MPERGSKTSTVLGVWENFGIFKARSKLFPILSQLVTMDETRRQSNNQWSGDIAAHSAPKNSECKNPLEKCSPRLFGIKTASTHLLSSKGPNYLSGVLLISAGATEGHLEGKTLRKFNQGGLVLARQYPGSLGTCNPEETGLPGLLMSWSSTLFSGPGLVGLTPVPWTEKPIESSPFFVRQGSHCCRAELVGGTIFWFFLSGLQKLERDKKCTELRRRYAE